METHEYIAVYGPFVINTGLKHVLRAITSLDMPSQSTPQVERAVSVSDSNELYFLEFLPSSHR